MKCISPYSGADNLGDGVIQAGHEVILAIDIAVEDTQGLIRKDLLLDIDKEKNDSN